MSKPKFVPINGEFYRVYTFFIDGKFAKVVIENPLYLNVSESGGHRVIDASGMTHYIPSGWILLSWETKPGFEKCPY